MVQEFKQVLDQAEENMEAALMYLDETFAQIRAGKANPRILDGIRVDYYGSQVPLSNVSTITTPDAKTIAVQPWEKNMITVIERAIQNSNVGITPMNNGEIIRLNIPPLTEERRVQLTKQVRAEGEEAKISIRNARRDAIEKFKKMMKDGLSEDISKDGENEAQKLHDKYVKKLEEMVSAKEDEIMTV